MQKSVRASSRAPLLILGVLALGAAGVLALALASASNQQATIEGESALFSGSANVTVEGDDQASGDEYIQFIDSTLAGGAPATYEENLARIQASTFRNREEDNSPYRDTPSVELYNKADLYTNNVNRDYMQVRGEYNGEFLFEQEYFPGNGAGAFRTNCEVSHFAYDDPIVFPGQPEAAHLHMFIGNTDTNAYSTYDTLIDSGGGTCNGGELNRTGYWVPALFNGEGEIVVPSKLKFYYKTEQFAGVGRTQLYPENLQILADSTNNTQGRRAESTWRCNTIWNDQRFQLKAGAAIPDCPATHFDPVLQENQQGAIELILFFDHCWNGKTDEVGDWKANRGGVGGVPPGNIVPPVGEIDSSVCPSSHPLLLPALLTHFFYDIAPGEDTTKWYLSSDVNPESRTVATTAGTSAHADWFGAWNRQTNQEFLDNCNNKPGGADCAAGALSDPVRHPNGRGLRLRNDWLTGWASEHARIPVEDVYSQMCSLSDQQPYSNANGGSMAAYCRPESSLKAGQHLIF